MPSTVIETGYHAMRVSLISDGDSLRITLFSADNKQIRSRVFTGALRRNVLRQVKAALGHSRRAALNLLWALLGYTPKMDKRPLARAMCAPR